MEMAEHNITVSTPFRGESHLLFHRLLLIPYYYVGELLRTRHCRDSHVGRD